jgi:hypothetical protein
MAERCFGRTLTAERRQPFSKLHPNRRYSCTLWRIVSLPCSYLQFLEDDSCPDRAFYLVEIISREGPRCQVAICREHIRKAWPYGQMVLDRRFPGRKLRLLCVRLMPILQVEKRAPKKKAKAAGA